MGSDVYAAIRDPLCRVVIVVTTAGNGKHGEYHWKSRLSGAILSVCRALPSWSPYVLNDRETDPLPCGFSVSYGCARTAGKDALRCEVRAESGAGAMLYMLHVPEPLAALHAGRTVFPLWPERAAQYSSWSELVATVEAILLDEASGITQALVYTADRSHAANPGDHDDHLLTSQAVSEIAARHPQFRPMWYSMYANQHKPENLDDRKADDQRSAIYAYGGGYMATAAGVVETWRTGWEREYPLFKRRQYRRELSPEDAAD
jgi:hypothetical protein